MEFGKYYVVEVSFRPNNPIHRAIAYNARGDIVTLTGSGYEHPETVTHVKMPWFRIVEEIMTMNCDYPNHFKLPREVEGEPRPPGVVT